MSFRGIMDFIELLEDHAAGMLYEALSKKYSTPVRDLIKRLEQFHEGEAKAHAFFEGLELEIRNSKKRLDNRLKGLKIDEEERKINNPLNDYNVGDYVYNKSGYLLGKVVKKLPKSLIVRKEIKLEDLIS